MDKFTTVYKTYNDNYYEIYTYVNHKQNSHTNKGVHSEESERISLSRTKRNIREICLCNDFHFFSTITINSINCDRFSLQQCQDLLRVKLKKIKRVNPHFKYIFITERHKNGAFHFHGLIKDTGDLYINDNGFLSSYVLDEIGFNSHSPIKDYNRCCNYIMKYITKDCVRNENNQIYISSRGLKKAKKEQMKFFCFDDFPNFYENDYICKTSFSLDELNLDQKLKIMKNWC